MPMLICPLCGRQVSLNHFDETRFSEDIQAINIVGLGRGKGFKITEQYSILEKGDPTVELITDRILLLSKALLDNDCMSQSDIVSALHIRVVPPLILKAKNKIIEDLTSDNIALKTRLNEVTNNSRRSNELTSDLSEEIIRLKTRINDFLDQLQDNDAITQNLSEEIIVLTEDRNHRLQQARELREIVRSRREKIESLEAQIEDLSEALIV